MNDGGMSAAAEGDERRARAARLRVEAQRLEREAQRLEAEAAAWDAGAEGERRVAAVLESLGADGVRALHDRLLHPGRSMANLDHIVLGPGGGFLVDTKNWHGDVTVHEGGLWRHRGSGADRVHEPMNAEVDKVRRMAEQAESVLGQPLEPVICLAGAGAHRFGQPNRVRGVLVVPIDALASWLRTSPPVLAPETVASLAAKAELLFPSGLDSAGVSAATVLRPAMSKVAWRPARVTAASPRRRQAHFPAGSSRPRMAGRSQRGLLRSLAVIAGLLLLAQCGPALIRAATSAARAATAKALAPLSTSIATPRPGAAGSTAPDTPCRSVTAERVRVVLGVRQVFPIAASLPGICQWGTRQDDVSSMLLQLRTGTYAIDSTSAREGRAVYTDRSDGVVLAVPAGLVASGSGAASAIPEPMTVWVSTSNLGRVTGKRISNDEARSMTRTFADDVARGYGRATP